MSADHYDAIVVGSGFGGSVTAYRLAEAGKRVLVLERGRPYPPGSFTRSPYRARESFWDPPSGLTGMYHYWSFRGIDALVSAGLGGGSLIYANVFIRKDENWFVQEDLADGGYEYWPVNRADLDPHYDRVEQMIGLQRFPIDHEPYASTPKTNAFKEAAEANGLEWFLPKLAVTFANEGRPPVPGEAIVEEIPNLHGRTRTTCQMVGECDVGCNYGAKNTLDYNYLTHAKHHGAELRTLADVRRFEPREGGGYEVRYADLSERPEDPPVVKLTCDHLILSAGTLGTTSLLLKNRSAFPGLSRKLGSRFCGNGDLLTLAINTSTTTNGVRTPRIVDPGLRPGDHLDRADARRAGRRHGPRLLPPGRRLPAAPGLGAARARRAAADLALARGRDLPGQELDQGHAGHRRDGQDRRADAAGRAVRGRPAAAGHGPRRAGRQDVPAQRPPRHRLAHAQGLARSTSTACAARRATSRPRSAAASPTTRCGSSTA